MKHVIGRGDIKENDTLLVICRGGERLAFLMYQMTYHHVAQGTLAGEPFMISYCAICHAGTGFVPVIKGREYHFHCAGVYNGSAILQDRETQSFWNPVTGECMHGPLKGERMEMLLLGQMTAGQALERWPDLRLALSKQPAWRKYILLPFMNFVGRFGIYPPTFKSTMPKRDPRFPDMTSGVGIMADGLKKFYPIEELEKSGGEVTDVLNHRPFIISVDEDGFPDVWYEDAEGPDDVPPYVYTRWYAFSLTFPDCKVFEPRSEGETEAAS
ncbi:DUF3179 domain-containing (seleno)protein [Melghirimyces profundicolus]|uniref:DUF3179 domain-containing (seleno)protein n=1 Tax=Melghirimyces profundicolus TaxID=1242148 RepID=UPI001475B701|nr:DUF3179 domain-containing (seleno)protein [Melghirimyces profundicolus]